MRPHPLDPVALVAGVTAVVAGVIATLHQWGTISLGLPLVVALGVLTLGGASAALVILESRRRATTRVDRFGN